MIKFVLSLLLVAGIVRAQDQGPSNVRTYTTVGDMVLNASPYSVRSVQVLGFYVAGDPGGGIFVPVHTTTPTVLGFVSSIASDYCWERTVPPGPIHSAWFGAVGDNVANDTVPLQNMANYLPITGGTLILDAGHFKITSPITFRTGSNLQGVGRDASRIFNWGTGDALIFPGDVNTTVRTVIKDLAVDGSPVSPRTAGNGIVVGSVGGAKEVLIENVECLFDFNGIVLSNLRVGTVRNCKFLNCAQDGLQTLGTCTALLAQNNYAKNCGRHGYALHNPVYSAFRDNAADGNSGDGYNINGTGSFGLTFSGNGAEFSSGHGFFAENLTSAQIESFKSINSGLDEIRLDGPRQVNITGANCASALTGYGLNVQTSTTGTIPWTLALRHSTLNGALGRINPTFSDIISEGNGGVGGGIGVGLPAPVGQSISVKGLAPNSLVGTDSQQTLVSGAALDTVVTVNTLRADTVTNMVNFPIPATHNNLVMLVSGRTGVNDQGGGTFYYDATPLAAKVGLVTNAGTHFAATTASGGQGRWIRQFTGPQSARWYGVVADGITDDTTNLTAAYQGVAATGNGGTLEIPAQTYFKQLWITNHNIHLRGGGFVKDYDMTRAKQTGWIAASTNFMIRVGNGADTNGLVKGFVLENATLLYPLNNFGGGAGIWWDQVQEATVRDVACWRFDFAEVARPSGINPATLVHHYNFVTQASGNDNSRAIWLKNISNLSNYVTGFDYFGGHVNGPATGNNTYAIECDGSTPFFGGTYVDMGPGHGVRFLSTSGSATYVLSDNMILDARTVGAIVAEVDASMGTLGGATYPFNRFRGPVETGGSIIMQNDGGKIYPLPAYAGSSQWYDPIVDDIIGFNPPGTYNYQGSASIGLDVGRNLKIMGTNGVVLTAPNGGVTANAPNGFTILNGGLLMDNQKTIWMRDPGGLFYQPVLSMSAVTNVTLNGPNSLWITTAGATRWIFNSDGRLWPQVTGTTDFGSTANRVGGGYFSVVDTPVVNSASTLNLNSTGIMTLTAPNVTANGTLVIVGHPVVMDNNQNFFIKEADTTLFSVMALNAGNNFLLSSPNDIYFTTGGALHWIMDHTAGTFYPQVTLTADIGKTAQRVRTGYFQSLNLSGFNSAPVALDASGNTVQVMIGAGLTYDVPTRTLAATGTGGGNTNYLGGINLGGGQVIYAGISGTNYTYKTLLASGSVSLSSDANTITITGAAGGGGTITGGASLGATGQPVYAGTVAPNLNFNSIAGAGGNTVSLAGNVITVTGSGGTITGGAGLGTGQPIYAGTAAPNLNFNSIVGTNGLVVTAPTNNTLTIGPANWNTVTIALGNPSVALTPSITNYFRFPYASTIKAVQLSLLYPSTSGNVVFDLKDKNGNLLFATIAAIPATFTKANTTLNSAFLAYAADDIVVAEIKAGGAGVNASGAQVKVFYTSP